MYIVCTSLGEYTDVVTVNIIIIVIIRAQSEIQFNPRRLGGYDILSTLNKPRGASQPPPHSPGYMSILQ